MDSRFDISTDEIVNNDIRWLPSDIQHVEDTINADPGWWKENPADGVGIRRFLNSDGQEQILSRSISVQLRSDLYTVQNPEVRFEPDGTLFINPNAVLQ